MLNENGRYKTNVSICLSISEHHQEQWDPMWNATTIITGTISMMQPGMSGFHNWEPDRSVEEIVKIAQKSKQAVKNH